MKKIRIIGFTIIILLYLGINFLITYFIKDVKLVQISSVIVYIIYLILVYYWFKVMFHKKPKPIKKLKYCAVVTARYRNFLHYRNKNSDMECIFVDSIDRSLGYEFSKIVFLHDFQEIKKINILIEYLERHKEQEKEWMI